MRSLDFDRLVPNRPGKQFNLLVLPHHTQVEGAALVLVWSCNNHLHYNFIFQLYMGYIAWWKNGSSNRFPEQHCICFSAKRSFKRWPAVRSLEDGRLLRDVSLSPTGMVGGVFAPADRFKLASQGQECLEYIVRSTMRQKARTIVEQYTHIRERNYMFLPRGLNKQTKQRAQDCGSILGFHLERG